MSKVGILVECGREGMESVICTRIGTLLQEETHTRIAIEILPMDNKQSLIEECGTAAQQLLANGCERVIILWDERPAWPRRKEKPCWSRERERILAELQKARIPRAKAYLVCIEREFESWLLFDDQMLACVLSKPAHPVHPKPPRHPDRIKNPKGAMMTLFRQHGGGPYIDVQVARRFAECLTDLARLRQCGTFRRFASGILGQPY